MSMKLTRDRHIFEIMLVVLVVGMTCLLFKLGGYKMVILNLFFLPVVLSGYYLGRSSAGVLALFSTISVSVATTLDATGFDAYSSPIMVGLAVTVWAAVLGLTALLVGTLCDERAAKVEELQVAYIGVVEVLSKYLQSANPRLKARSERVAELSQALAAEMRLPEREIEDIRVAALLRDIGNMEITTKLISKAMDTLEENPAQVDKHTFLGMELVHSLGSVLRGAVPLLVNQDDAVSDCLAEMDGLPGIGIPVGARVIRTAQAYEELVTPTAGGPQATPQEALAQLQRDLVIRKDRDVLIALQRVISDRRRDASHHTTPYEPALTM